MPTELDVGLAVVLGLAGGFAFARWLGQYVPDMTLVYAVVATVAAIVLLVLRGQQKVAEGDKASKGKGAA